jgi:hypothetical protein
MKTHQKKKGNRSTGSDLGKRGSIGRAGGWAAAVTEGTYRNEDRRQYTGLGVSIRSEYGENEDLLKISVGSGQTASSSGEAGPTESVLDDGDTKWGKEEL